MPAYALYRRWLTFRERSRFEDLLRRAATLPVDLDLEPEVDRQLRERSAHRQKLPVELAQATVVGVGARGWERFGLWPSFERTCDFHFFGDGLADDEPFACHTRAAQSERCERLLAFVRELHARHPVHVVFIYANATNLSPRLFRELQAMGCWTILMGLDDRHTLFSPHEKGLGEGAALAAEADLYWTTWRTGRLLHHMAGSRAWLGGLGADPAFHHPVEVPKDIPVLFLGVSYGVRRELVESLKAMGIPVEGQGYGWSRYLTFDETIRSISRAKIVLGISNVGSMDGVSILKGRDFEVPMCGATYVTQYSEELGDFFDIGKDVVCYGSRLQAAEVLVSLLRDEGKRRALARNALEASRRRNTWEIRLREMYDRLLRSQAESA